MRPGSRSSGWRRWISQVAMLLLQQAEEVERGERRRAEPALEAEAESPEREAIQQEVREVGVDEAARDERVVVAALGETVRSQEIARDQRRPSRTGRAALKPRIVADGSADAGAPASGERASFMRRP